ncbi:MAG TPA: glutaredoxin domain-containing protein [Gammaproteobacteria bacterium]|nr:glutaredoxin domain-containing protein [Gammaproteobacteria bacterium]
MIDPDSSIEIYTIRACGFCAMAKEMLQSHGIHYMEHDVTSDALKRREMLRRSRSRGLPQIFIDGEFVGGCHELKELLD